MSVLALDCFSAFETGIFFPEFSSAEFGGFGSRRLISQSFLGAKAPLQPWFVKKTAFFSAKAQSCKKLRFLRYSAKQNSWIVCRLTPWNSARCFRIQRKLNSGLWLGAFGKVWLFRCQSGIRGLWLGAFGKSGFFRCQSRSSRLTLLPLETPVLPTAVCKS